MKSIIVLIAVLSLFGCVNTKPKVEIVEVPVAVPCLGDIPEEPVYKFDWLPVAKSDAESADQVRVLWKDGELAKQYGRDLKSATAGCLLLKK